MNHARSKTHYENGLEAKSNRDYLRANNEIRLAIEIDPNHAEAHRELGWLTYGTGGSLSLAREHLETALRINPKLGDAHMYLGIVLNRLSKLLDSETHFKEALEFSDHPAIVHCTYAEEFLWHNGQYGNAEAHFLAALEISPDLALALRDYARMLACHGRDAEAKQLLERAIEADPNDWQTKRAYEEFVCEVHANDRDPAECLRTAVEKDPSYVGGIEALNNRHD